MCRGARCAPDKHAALIRQIELSCLPYVIAADNYGEFISFGIRSLTVVVAVVVILNGEYYLIVRL